MKRITIVATAVLVVAGAGVALTDDGGRRIEESLNGFKEAAAVVSTTGTGTFRATISHDEDKIAYRLTFSDLEGDITQAHIHIGHPQNWGASSCGCVKRLRIPRRLRPTAIRRNASTSMTVTILGTTASRAPSPQPMCVPRRRTASRPKSSPKWSG